MKSRKGFTLIEILIVVAIIGLLASVVLVGLAPAQKRGRDARRLADLKEVQNALELYYGACGHYPGGAAPACGAATAGAMDWGILSTTLKNSSIGVNNVPTDPSSGRAYQYVTNDKGTSYVLAASLEDANNPALKQEVGMTLPDGVTGLTGTCGADIYCAAF